MADRERRKAEAAKHNALMNGVFASETQASIDALVVYEDGEGRDLPIPDPAFERTETMVTTSFIPEAMVRHATGKAVVVDPAAFTRPGGAYEDGAFGPEQAICSRSNLYQILCGIKEAYHDQNRDYRRGQLFTDRAAYLPDVVFSCDGAVRKADVVAVAEPLRARALENHRSERECDNTLANRVETFMRIAAANGCETLVCGAFGCGRLGYPDEQAVEVMKSWIDAHPGVLARVVFAVPRAHFDAFDAAFGRPKDERSPVPAEDVEDEGEDLGFSAEDLPEGVTFRG